MQAIKNISIPNPCHQSWQQMTPVEQGRHCQSCAKIVTDFTEMPASDIIAYFNTNGKTCGRFSPAQLTAINTVLEPKKRSRFSWKGLAAAASLISLIPNLKAQAQQVNKTEQAPSVREKNSENAKADSALITTIVKGKIIAKADKLPLPGVNVMIKGSTFGAVTDVDGNFRVQVVSASNILVINYIGYKTIEVAVAKSAQTLEIELEAQQVIMGEIAIMRQPVHKRIWHKIKRIF